ncbi:MAG: cupin [Theionarchaea archaeon DG-70]|nr:MAG: cupin [Theionarchaea archaeon DG-70]
MLIKKLNGITAKEIIPGFHGRFVHSPHMTLAHWNIKAGSPLPEHSHPHEQITTVLEGTLELTTEGKTHVLTPGSVAVIPSDVPHSGKAVTDCRVIDVFYPRREDYQ